MKALSIFQHNSLSISIFHQLKKNLYLMFTKLGPMRMPQLFLMGAAQGVKSYDLNLKII